MCEEMEDFYGFWVIRLMLAFVDVDRRKTFFLDGEYKNSIGILNFCLDSYKIF